MFVRFPVLSTVKTLATAVYEPAIGRGGAGVVVGWPPKRARPVMLDPATRHSRPCVDMRAGRHVERRGRCFEFVGKSMCASEVRSGAMPGMPPSSVWTGYKSVMVGGSRAVISAAEVLVGKP